MAMRRSNINMTTVVDKLKLLETLQENLTKHIQIVKEAKEGYLEKAQAAVLAKLEQLKNGEIVSLHFSLDPPDDYSEVYENSVEMLKWNTAATVSLEADEFRHLVRDEWDWTDNFFMSNSSYSQSAFHVAKAKKLI